MTDILQKITEGGLGGISPDVSVLRLEILQELREIRREQLKITKAVILTLEILKANEQL